MGFGSMWKWTGQLVSYNQKVNHVQQYVTEWGLAYITLRMCP